MQAKFELIKGVLYLVKVLYVVYQYECHLYREKLKASHLKMTKVVFDLEVTCDCHFHAAGYERGISPPFLSCLKSAFTFYSVRMFLVGEENGGKVFSSHFYAEKSLFLFRLYSARSSTFADTFPKTFALAK